jgi:L-rhamnose mutarotase
MTRVGFRLALTPEKIDEYVTHHAAVWPEMLEALRECGWSNYSLFLDRNDATLFGYFETDNYESALAQMSHLEVNERWQRLMAPFFQSLNGARPDEMFLRLENIFFLP